MPHQHKGADDNEICYKQVLKFSAIVWRKAKLEVTKLKRKTYLEYRNASVTFHSARAASGLLWSWEGSQCLQKFGTYPSLFVWWNCLPYLATSILGDSLSASNRWRPLKFLQPLISSSLSFALLLPPPSAFLGSLDSKVSKLEVGKSS